MRKNQRMVLIENRNDPACPVTALTLFRMCCPPDQDRVFCTHATNAQKKNIIQLVRCIKVILMHPLVTIISGFGFGILHVLLDVLVGN